MLNNHFIFYVFQLDAEPISALEKQRQKTRYSNDDLFKPRPVLSGGSRSRRRINGND